MGAGQEAWEGDVLGDGWREAPKTVRWRLERYERAFYISEGCTLL